MFNRLGFQCLNIPQCKTIDMSGVPLDGLFYVKAMDALERVNILDKYDQRSDELSVVNNNVSSRSTRTSNYFS